MPRYIISQGNSSTKLGQETNLSSAKAKARKLSKEYFVAWVWNFDTRQVLVKFEEGKEIETQSNPAKGKWIKATAIKFLGNGKIQVKV